MYKIRIFDKYDAGVTLDHIKEMVTRLRSGDYKQGKVYLKGAACHCHCAEGILAEILEEDGILESKTTEYATGFMNKKSDENVAVYGEYVIPGIVFYVRQNDDVQHHLWKLNDGCTDIKSHSFNEIADIIESAIEENSVEITNENT